MLQLFPLMLSPTVINDDVPPLTGPVESDIEKKVWLPRESVRESMVNVPLLSLKFESGIDMLILVPPG